MDLKSRITEDMKDAMRNRDAARLSTIRLLLAAIKQREIDDRTSLDEAQTVAVVDKLIKQRRESASQYDGAGREDLAAKERAEIEVLSAYLPQAAEPAEIAAAIDAAIAETGAAGQRDMGRVMNLLRARLVGRADLAAVSARVKERLAGA
ncbi:MAG: GatB/YqeY domain-containing protein [Gemmatimonadales bacterium]|nr:GatB/YqeY domain-containing protein [Gemmatimonadales bacterium]